MARILFGIIFVAFFLSFHSQSFADEKFPIVSANGFSCSQNDGMVTCRGAFPNSPTPVFESSGKDVVWIRAEFPGERYTYYSDSGCLCQADFKSQGEVKTQKCTSQFGHEKTFKGGKSTYDWCKKN